MVRKLTIIIFLLSIMIAGFILLQDNLVRNGNRPDKIHTNRNNLRDEELVVEPCNDLRTLNSESISVLVADTEHSISYIARVCVDTKAIPQNNFEKFILTIIQEINVSLSTIKKEELFYVENRNYIDDTAMFCEMIKKKTNIYGNPPESLAKSIALIRIELLQKLSMEFSWINNICFDEFLIK